MPVLQRIDRLRYEVHGPDGAVIGRGARSRELHGQPLRSGQQLVDVWVEPAFRGSGIGTALYRALERDARKTWAESLACAVAADDEDSLRWAEGLGFRFDYQMVAGELDLTQFDLAQWSGAVAAAQSRGVRFTSLLQAQDERGVLKNLYELDEHLSRDVPQWSGVMPGYKDYCAAVEACDPEGVISAWADGCPVGYSMTDNDGYTEFMGVTRAYRGQGIALALKLLTIRWALHKGLQCLRTHNNAATEPILALNRRLGYVMRLDTTYLVKDITG
ncbi:MAG TPA: GNAT family N-acetyltransferase [Symbiobacteriaceae bacterium]|nr:GNAT family N-acetyltransferase [Symbiobacteriaceae bacterium]